MKLSQVAKSLQQHLNQALNAAQAEFQKFGNEFEEAHCIVQIGDLEYHVASAHYRRNHASGHIELVHVVDSALGIDHVDNVDATKLVESLPAPDTVNGGTPAAAPAPGAAAPAPTAPEAAAAASASN